MKPDRITVEARTDRAIISIDTTGRRCIVQYRSPPDSQGVLPELRILLSSLVLLNGGLLLHSSAIADENSSILFTGQSGAGKTTIAEMAASCSSWKIYSDECNAIISYNGSFQVYATPFGRTLPEPRHTVSGMPLKALYFLNKDRAFRIIRPDFAEQYRKLLANAIWLHHDKGLSTAAMVNARAILSVIKVDNLYFSLNSSLSDFLEQSGVQQ